MQKKIDPVLELERENRQLRQQLAQHALLSSEERDRLLRSLQKAGRAILSSLDRDEILNNLAAEIATAGIFESLMVALVDREHHRVEVVRSCIYSLENGSHVLKEGTSQSLGITYDLDDENITAVVARSGQMQILDEWDDRYDKTVDDPGARRGRTAYFIPIKNGDQVVAVLATGSPISEKESMLHRIEVLQPLFDQIALALEHARLYRELGEERKLLEVTLGSIGDGVIATDPQGLIILMNDRAQALSGWSRERAIGRKLQEVIGGDERVHAIVGQLLETALRDVELAHSSQQVELRGVANEQVLARLHATPIHSPDQGVVGVVLVVQDITQQQKLQEEVYRSRRIESLGLLAGGIAHDFNNILAAALINTSLLKLQKGMGEMWEAIIPDIETSLLQARDLTQQLMTFTKDAPLVRKTAAVEELVRESATFVLRGSNVSCIFDISTDVWPVDIDSTQISQVVQNLIINANQAMPDGGSIRVCLENVQIDASAMLPLEAGRYIRCSVVDTGGGISEENLGRIFDPYFTTKQEGSGLGLASAFTIINNHDGWMTVESQVGSGSEFVFYLPAAIGKARPELEAQGVPRGKGRVLLMDDDVSLCQAAERALAHLGYQLVLVHDGSEAIKLYEQSLKNGHAFDVVVLDLTIPGGMGGEEAARRLRALDPKVCLIVSSGYSKSPILADCRAHGFREWVTKPYTMDELGQVVGRAMAQD